MAKKRATVFEKYGYLWITFAFFVLSIVGHWILAWFAYVNEQQSLGQPIEVSEYLVEVGRDTLENWQSEFLQLMWQVGGLALLLSIGSPQSKEGDERKEEKIDQILAHVHPKGEKLIAEIDAKYFKE
jgi:hypothetical protein